MWDPRLARQTSRFQHLEYRDRGGTVGSSIRPGVDDSFLGTQPYVLFGLGFLFSIYHHTSDVSRFLTQKLGLATLLGRGGMEGLWMGLWFDALLVLFLAPNIDFRKLRV